MNKLRVYPLRDLPPEVVAVAFAKCSRSPDSFDKIVGEVTKEKSSDFHEKWVVNFGHASIAEHAFMNIAIENVSLVAVECIQGNRLGSFTEKSSRYQIYSKDKIYTPSVFKKDKKILKIYQEAISQLFETYQASFNPVRQVILKLYPSVKGEKKKSYEGRIRSKWMDVCRYLLPNSSLANLGVSCNARTWEYAICKMLSHPLKEVQDIGRQCKKVTLEITPTLVKYADFNKYYVKNYQAINNLGTKWGKSTDKELDKITINLIDYDKNAEDKILAALLYRNSSISYKEALKRISQKSKKEKKKIFDEIIKGARNIYDKPPRELEYIDYTFDCYTDQGAYYDLKRNRIMTQTPQRLSFNYGFLIPRSIKTTGLEKKYSEAQKRAQEAYFKIYNKFPEESQYITTKASGRRYLIKMNLREAFYFIGLRTTQAGHFAYREAVQQIWKHINRVHPNLAKYIVVNLSKSPGR